MPNINIFLKMCTPCHSHKISNVNFLKFIITLFQITTSSKKHDCIVLKWSRISLWSQNFLENITYANRLQIYRTKSKFLNSLVTTFPSGYSGKKTIECGIYSWMQCYCKTWYWWHSHHIYITKGKLFFIFFHKYSKLLQDGTKSIAYLKMILKVMQITKP